MSGKKGKQVSLRPQQQKTAAMANPDTVPRWAIFALLLAIAIVFSGAWKNGITFIDDDMYILRNPYLRDFSIKGIAAIFTSFYEYNYHPLTTLTWLIEYRFFGVDPTSYHMVSVALHLLNVWLVYRLASALSGKSFTGLVVAALFAVHPLHVESVAWISERKGLLCATFYFASLLYYLRYVDDGYSRRNLIIALLFFLAALLSKSAAVTLPLVVMAIDWYRKRNVKTALAEKLPFLALSVLFGVLAIMSQKAGGAIGDVASEYSIMNRVVVFLAGLSFYFIKAVVPFHLSAIHYFPGQVNGALPWWTYAYLLALPVVAWGAAGRGNNSRDARFGLLFFLLVMSVMLQLVPVGAAYASERYSYVSFFGLFYVAAQWLTRRKGQLRHTLVAGLWLCVLVFGIVSWGRVGAWKDTETVFNDLVEKNAGNKNLYLVHYHWGDYYQYMGNMDAAVAQFSKAIDINRAYTRSYLRRGEIYDIMQKGYEAIADYDTVMRRDPSSAIAYSDKGWVVFEMGDPKLAISLFDSAIAKDSKLATAYNNRGWVRLQTGDTASAMADFTRAISADGRFPKPYYNRALVNVVRGKKEAAIADYTRLLDVNPSDAQAWYYRGIMYMELHRNLSARADLQKAASLRYPGAEQALAELNR